MKKKQFLNFYGNYFRNFYHSFFRIFLKLRVYSGKRENSKRNCRINFHRNRLYLITILNFPCIFQRKFFKISWQAPFSFFWKLFWMFFLGFSFCHFFEFLRQSLCKFQVFRTSFGNIIVNPCESFFRKSAVTPFKFS